MSPKDRDVYVGKHTPPAGVPAFIDEECTGKYEGEELAARRAKRPTHERLSKLETKADESAKADQAFAVSLARMETKVDTVLGFVKGDRENEHKTNRVRITSSATSRATIIVGVVGAVCTAAGVIIAAVLAGCA